MAMESAKASRVTMPWRVMYDRLAEVLAELGEVFDEGNQRVVVHAVDAAHELEVVEPWSGG